MKNVNKTNAFNAILCFRVTADQAHSYTISLIVDPRTPHTLTNAKPKHTTFRLPNLSLSQLAPNEVKQQYIYNNLNTIHYVLARK